MKFTSSRSTGLVCLGISLFTTTIFAHTWIEELRIIASNGTMTGVPGYPRGNVLRTSPSFSDTAMVNLLPPDGGSNAFTASMKMCRPGQVIGNQTPGSPALQASPGDKIALRYQENGHVTLPDTNPGKPANRGTVFVYGTTQPSNDDTLLGIHGQWTPDGKGGDGRGVLLATRNYDDGQCYQINSGAISTQRQQQFPHTADPLMGTNMWCQSDIQIPQSTKASGIYTLYWVWDWPTAVGTIGVENGKNQTYTTCIDVQLSPGNGGSSKASIAFAVGQDLNNAAIQAQLENPFLVPVSGASDSGSGSSAGAVAPSSSSSPPPSSSSNDEYTIKTVTVTEQVTEKITTTQIVYGPSPTINSPVGALTSTEASSTAVPIGEATTGDLTIPAPASTTSPISSDSTTHTSESIPETTTTPKPSPNPTSTVAPAASPAPQGAAEGDIGSLTVTPFLISDTPVASTTLATVASTSKKTPDGVEVTKVDTVSTTTITSYSFVTPAASLKIRGRWVVVSAV